MTLSIVLNPAMNSAGAVVIDANVTVAVSAQEANTGAKATAALAQYSNSGFLFYAPGVIVSESLYALCGKSQTGLLTPTEYARAVLDLQSLMAYILSPPGGDASLMLRAEQLRAGYGCSRSADGLYIALAEELSRTRVTRLLTFDQDLPKQAARHAPGVHVHLLT